MDYRALLEQVCKERHLTDVLFEDEGQWHVSLINPADQVAMVVSSKSKAGAIMQALCRLRDDPYIYSHRLAKLSKNGSETAILAEFGVVYLDDSAPRRFDICSECAAPLCGVWVNDYPTSMDHQKSGHRKFCSWKKRS